MVSEVEKEIFRYIDNRESFIIEAGAGSGKTWTLVQALKYVIAKNEVNYSKNNQKIACITYTNVAKEEIVNRVNGNKLVNVKTIHEFLWSIVEPFQKELKNEFLTSLEDKLKKDLETMEKATKKTTQIYKNAEESSKKNQERISVLQKSNIRIKYSDNANYKKGIISHDLMLELSKNIITKSKVIKKIIQDSYPVIFIDEYQDTKKEIAAVIMDYLKPETSIVFGFFGDFHQQIYNGSIGRIDPEKNELRVIRKKENYRSEKGIVDLLNKIRDDGLEQESKRNNEQRGKCSFFYVDNEVLDMEQFIVDNIMDEFTLNTNSQLKKLYLVTKAIAKQNDYLKLHELYDERTSPNFRIGQIKPSFSDMLMSENREQNEVAKVIYELLPQNIKESINNNDQINDNEDFIEEMNKNIIKNKKFNEIDVFSRDASQLANQGLKYDEINRKLLELHFPVEFLRYDTSKDRRLKNKDMILRNSNNKDCPFANFLFDIEEIIELYQNNKIQQLLKKTSYPLNNLQGKINLNKLMGELILRSESENIAEVFAFVTNNKILKFSEKLELIWKREDKKDAFFYNLMELEYVQFKRLYHTVKDTSPYSTNHGTKGAEFESVICFINDSDWNQYSIDEYLSEQDTSSTKHYRTRNLFYVICSRAKLNLAIIVMSKLSEKSLEKARYLFGEENVYKNYIKTV